MRGWTCGTAVGRERIVEVDKGERVRRREKEREKVKEAREKKGRGALGRVKC